MKLSRMSFFENTRKNFKLNLVLVLFLVIKSIHRSSRKTVMRISKMITI